MDSRQSVMLIHVDQELAVCRVDSSVLYGDAVPDMVLASIAKVLDIQPVEAGQVRQLPS